jgi:superfamily II DNA/RNA helicase
MHLLSNLINSNKDCIIQSKSGTGKTATYLLGVLNKMSPNNLCQGMIITPTRELSIQVYTVVKGLSKYTNFKNSICVGGSYLKDNIDDLKNTNLIIGTVGRIFNLIELKHIKLKMLKFIVLDEVDDLLHNGIDNKLNYIFSNLNTTTQKILISATITINVFNLSKKFMNSPNKLLLTNEEVIVDLISQFYIDIENEEQKYETLLDLYNLVSTSQAIIFCNSINTVKWLEKKLTEDNFPIIAMHSNIMNIDRNKIMDDFRNGNSRLLLTTDLLARGIDIPTVNLVINFELPQIKETYIHRIGRCGRFNKKGIAISIIKSTDIYDKKFISKLINEYNINIKEMPDSLDEFI